MEANQTESLEFQAEVKQLLRILAHSLYTEREVFLRELISNASDALHRVQFEMLTNREVVDPEAELAVHVDFDEDARLVTVSDPGIGMTRDELAENLGTIAHSGAMAFLQGLEEGQRPNEVIGQFGVGFYSVYMVAEEVTVTSRSYRPDAQAWAWTSRGENTYTLAPTEKSDRGTRVEIRLKEEAGEFASAWRLERVIKKHSNFISFPIYLQDQVINEQKALWRRSPQEVKDEEYESFYRQLTLDFNGPLRHLHIAADVPIDLHAVLFIPQNRERGLLRGHPDYGLKLYSKNVLIQENHKELLPAHLRFVEGVVDSEDLPLNISRESIQADRTLARIRKVLTGRVIRTLSEMSAEDTEDYGLFWAQFGPFLKEGAATDPTSQEDIVPLLRFHSSHPDVGLTSLEAYLERMKEGQEAIYYVFGESLASVARSPHLDYFRSHELEVLYLVDPLDSFLAQSLREVEGKPLRNVDDADLKLPGDEEEEQDPEVSTLGDLDTLIDRFKKVLGERVADVRPSRLLTDSPCRLVSPGDVPNRDLERVRRLLEQDFEVPPKILEVNPGHPLLQNLAGLIDEHPDDGRIDPVIEQLFENMLLLEGLHPDPAQMVPRLQTILKAATE
jgi:molecular chaperone HtpG